MAARKKSKGGKKYPQDRLSDLPDNIIHKILSNDTKQAVQTSVLSKRWKHLWKSVPDLRFHSSPFTRLKDFKKFVLHVLSHRDGNSSIGEFLFHHHGQYDQSLTNRVIKYAVSHNVKSLSIRPQDLLFHSPVLLKCQSINTLKLGDVDHMSLPESSLYKSLTALHLSGCSFHYDNENECFDPFVSCQNLRTLYLHGCHFWEISFKVLKISLPKLVNLTISSMRDGCELPKDCKVEIFAPKLSFFCFASTSPLYFSMLDVSSLESVVIDLQADPRRIPLNLMEEKEKANRDLINMFQGLRNAQFVTLSFETIMVLTGIPGMLEGHPSPFHRLKLLKLRLQHAHKPSKIPAHVITYLLSDFPGSATLEIEPSKDNRNERVW